MTGCRSSSGGRGVVAIASFSDEAAERVDAIARLLLRLDDGTHGLALVLPFEAALLSDVPKVRVGIFFLEQDHVAFVVFRLFFAETELVLRVGIR